MKNSIGKQEETISSFFSDIQTFGIFLLKFKIVCLPPGNSFEMHPTRRVLRRIVILDVDAMIFCLETSDVVIN